MIWILILAYLFIGVGINGVTVLLYGDRRQDGLWTQAVVILLWPLVVAAGALVSFIDWAGL